MVKIAGFCDPDVDGVAAGFVAGKSKFLAVGMPLGTMFKGTIMSQLNLRAYARCYRNDGSDNGFVGCR